MKSNFKSWCPGLIGAGARGLVWRGWSVRAFLLVLALVLLSWPLPTVMTVVAEPPAELASVAAGFFNVPQAFIVRGRGIISVDGIQDDFPGGFEMSYLVYPDGRVTISRLVATIGDGNYLVRDRRVLRDIRIELHCSRGANRNPITAMLDPTGKLVIPPGAAMISGVSYPERAEDGSCPGRGDVLTFEATNNAPLQGRHDPMRDEFTLEGRFRAMAAERETDVTITMTGHYVNRPPVAIIGVRGRGLPAILGQGGCPPTRGVNPPTTEANDPRGLLVTLISASDDPDGSFRRSDIRSEQWYHAPGPVPLEFLGFGREIGPVLFEFGPEHRLGLLVTDLAGAISSDGCFFKVVDTTPPLVLPPSRITLLCTERGGASARTSRALREFLIGARTSDNSDPAPMPLPPQVDGMDVTEKTLFPLDRGQHPQPCFTPVVFRFQDRHGNIGAAISGVRVVDRRPPDLSVDLFPNLLQPTFEFVTIRADILTADVCGGVSVILDAIVADPPPPPQSDLVLIRGAEFGTDDREFQLRAAPAIGPNQQPVDRIYTVTYVAVDEFGNKTQASAEVIVKAMGQ